jgi:hypothetical protein
MATVATRTKGAPSTMTRTRPLQLKETCKLTAQPPANPSFVVAKPMLSSKSASILSPVARGYITGVEPATREVLRRDITWSRSEIQGDALQGHHVGSCLETELVCVGRGSSELRLQPRMSSIPCLTSCQFQKELQRRLSVIHAIEPTARSSEEIHPFVSGCECGSLHTPWGGQ